MVEKLDLKRFLIIKKFLLLKFNFYQFLIWVLPASPSFLPNLFSSLSLSN